MRLLGCRESADELACSSGRVDSDVATRCHGGSHCLFTPASGCQQLHASTHSASPAATVVVLGLLPMEPLMLHAPQRIFGPMVSAANAELQQYVAAQGSERLKYKGGGMDGCGGC